MGSGRTDVVCNVVPVTELPVVTNFATAWHFGLLRLCDLPQLLYALYQSLEFRIHENQREHGKMATATNGKLQRHEN